MGIITLSDGQPLLPPPPARIRTRASALAGPYDAASHGRRMVSWNPGSDNVNSALMGASETLRARSRDMVRQNAWAGNAADTFVSNVVSTGIKPQSQHPIPKTKQSLQDRFLLWTDEADAAGITDFYGIEAMVVRAVFEGGECFVRLRYRYATDGLSVPLQLQVLEAEHVPINKNEDLPNGNKIRCGIEFNKFGQRVAYHMYPEHPGSGNTSLFADSTTTVRVAASEVLHVFRPLRPGQLRGQPWLTPVLVKLYEIDQFDDATLMAQKIAAMFAGFIVENDSAESIIPTTTASGATTLNADEFTNGGMSAPEGVDFGGLEPGTMQKLLPGEDVKFSTPPGTSSTYVEFMRMQLRAIAAGIGVTFEQLTGDLSGVNYSSIRAGLLEFRRRAEQFQHQVLVYQFCRPVWNAWVQTAILSGAIIAPDFRANPLPYKSVKWIAPGWPWVDPLKDMTAQRLAVRSGFTSRSSTVSATGEDAEVIDAEQKADNDRADKYGLTYDSDARQNVDSGELVTEPEKAGGKPTDDDRQDSDKDAKIDDLLFKLNALLDERS